MILPSRLDVKGGKGGHQWDDGANHDGVTKIHVRGGFDGIQYIKFNYVKNGETQDGPIHGISGSGFTQTFEINHFNDEHLVYVEGYYDDASGVIQALQFKTNLKTSDVLGYEKGKKFLLADKGKKIIGFHGYAEKNLNSLGAYFTTVSLTKSERHAEKLRAQGGLRGESWDDGVFDSVRKLYVGQGDNGVAFLKVVYGRDTRNVIGEDHGNTTPLEVKEFELEYPSEYITAVDGCYDKVIGSEVEVITMLRFTTNKRTSIPVGFVSTSSFLLYKDGFKIVGFHGKSSNMINQLGVHVLPFTY
ncbi:hypothetical protein YC2023_115089 [Brassica napus]